MRNVALLYKYGTYQHTLMYGAAQENVTIFQIMCMKRYQSRNTPYLITEHLMQKSVVMPNRKCIIYASWHDKRCEWYCRIPALNKHYAQGRNVLRKIPDVLNVSHFFARRIHEIYIDLLRTVLTMPEISVGNDDSSQQKFVRR